MLSEDAIDNLVQPIVDRQESINMYVIQKIANRLKSINKLTKSDVQALRNLAVTGADIREINSEISKQSGLQVREIKQVIKITAADTYADTKPFYDYRHRSYIPFEQNDKMQRIMEGIANQTRYTYINLSNSSATGFLLRDANNPLKTDFYKIVTFVIEGGKNSSRLPGEQFRQPVNVLLIRTPAKHDIRQQYFVPKNPHPHTKYHDKCH